jgi:hypothetical protein
MKMKRKPVLGVRRADDPRLPEKALERTNAYRYRAHENSSKCTENDNDNDNDSDTEKHNYYNNNNNYNNNNHDNHNGGNDDENNVVPLEIDTHFQMYGKHMWDVQYGERCPLCNKRIDEYGFCACGSGGE